jgi:hypothetical protein
MSGSHGGAYEDTTGLQRRVVSLKNTDVSQMRTASIIRAIMDAVRIPKTSI